MRRLIDFMCGDDRLVATIDDAPGATGLLIVSGGREVRAGAHRGMAMLAARLADGGIPVFRYDRRGIGDSEGIDPGYADGAADLRAALAAFRAEAPQVNRIVGFGNCDAATTLALHGAAAGIDAVVLANPWVVEDDDTLPPVEAIAARYRARLRDPAAWGCLMRGRVDPGKALRGIAKLLRGRSDATDLTVRVTRAIADQANAVIVLAEGDATAQAFEARWRDAGGDRTAVPIVRIATASHSFAADGDMATLEAAIRTHIDR